MTTDLVASDSAAPPYRSGALESAMGLTGLKPGAGRAASLSGGSGGELISLPFPVSGGCLHSLACGPLLHLQSQQWWIESFSHGITLTSSFCLPLPVLRTFVIMSGSPG